MWVSKPLSSGLWAQHRDCGYFFIQAAPSLTCSAFYFFVHTGVTSQKQNVSQLSQALSKRETSSLPARWPLPFPSLSLSLGASKVLLGGSSQQLSTLFKFLQQSSKLEACFHRFKLRTQQGPPGRPGVFISPSSLSEVLSEVQNDVITIKVRLTAQPLVCCVILNKLLNLSEFHLVSCKKESIMIYRVVVIT